MDAILLYSSEKEPVTRSILANSRLHSSYIPLSLNSLLNEISIFDRIEEGIPTINWYFSKDREITNNSSTFLINRVNKIPSAIFSHFAPGEREYAMMEFKAYLQFAIESFPHASSYPGINNLMGDRPSLPDQWRIVEQSFSSLLNTPSYYLGDLTKFAFSSGKWIQSTPFEYYYWKSSPLSITNQPYCFLFKQPLGNPWIACTIGEQTKIYPHLQSSAQDSFQPELLKEIAGQVHAKFKTPISESLFFLAPEGEITFGMISDVPYVSSKFSWFDSMVEEWFLSLKYLPKNSD